MTAHDWFVEHRTAYVTRTLDPREEQSFADHLPRCDECRGAVTELEAELGWLPMGVVPVTPPPGFHRRAVTHVLRDHQRPWKRWAVGIALAAAASLLVVATTVLQRSLAREARLAAQLEQSHAALAALSDTVDILRRAAKVLQASIEMNDHRGALMVFADDSTHRWNVVMHGLPPAPPGEKYQLWFISADGMLRAVELKPTGDGTLIVTVGMPESGETVIGASLSVELVTNTSNQPRGKELAHLML